MADDRGGTRWRSPDEPCLNCGDPTPGRYCPSCGQRKTDVAVSLRTIIGDVVEDELIVNRALPRTIVALLIHPGQLTQEYVRGRIRRYIPPFRLYLVASVVFFLILSFVGLRGLDTAFPNIRLNIDPSIDADSAYVALVAQRAALDTLDTANLPAVARMGIDQARAVLSRQIDSLAAVRGEADAPVGPAAPVVMDTAAAATGADTAAPGVPWTPQAREIQPWARNITIEAAGGRFEQALRRKVEQVAHLRPREAIRVVIADMLQYAPHMVFLLLPVFALLLKLLYIRRDRFYAEHFVFALHVHAFVFLIFILMFVLPWAFVRMALFAWLFIYIWIAMRRVYRQGWFRTTVKWWVLGASYAVIFLFGLLGLMLATLLLT